MKKVDLTDEERAAWLDIERAGGRRLARDVGDDERRRDNERWDRLRELQEEMRRTGEDPYFARLRRAAAEATGGESCNPGRETTKSSREER